MDHNDKGRDEEGGCVGKERFRSARIAWEAAGRRPGRNAYRCPFCGSWHVGSRLSKKGRRQDRAWGRREKRS